jgi:hypothetical protein
MYRKPADEMLPGTRLASIEELFLANQGYEFPWGRSPDATRASRLWKEQRIGMGGLVFDRWFVTANGRFGGAPNVPATIPATLRNSLLVGGGTNPEDWLEANEGFALIKDVPAESLAENSAMRRAVQVYASQHVAADGGAIITSPIGANNTVHIGFVGRCMFCPNAEIISFQALKAAVPGYDFQLFPEWENWKA